MVTDICNEHVQNSSIYRTLASKLCHMIFEPESTKDPSMMNLPFIRVWTVCVPVTSVIRRKLIYLLHYKDSCAFEDKITEQLTFRCWMFWRAEDNLGRHCKEMVESVSSRYKWTRWFLLQWRATMSLINQFPKWVLVGEFHIAPQSKGVFCEICLLALALNSSSSLQWRLKMWREDFLPCYVPWMEIHATAKMHTAQPTTRRSWKPLCSRKTMTQLLSWKSGAKVHKTGPQQEMAVKSAEGVGRGRRGSGVVLYGRE